MHNVLRCMIGAFALTILIMVFSLSQISRGANYSVKAKTIYSGSDNNVTLFCSENEQQEGFNVRLLSFKHSKEHMADVDADMAVDAVKKAAGRGLRIRSIGNHFVDKNGKMRVSFIDFEWNIDKFRQFLNEQLKVDATPGDTVVLFTIGHGMPSGNLDNLGQRKDVMLAIAEAAEANQQRILWWQLSCYASAKLPPINSLTPAQQELLNILPTSDAKTPSAAYVQGKIMEKVFNALAEKSKDIDPDGDGVVRANEFKTFLNKATKSEKGTYLQSRSPDSPIFGGSNNLANQIPIVDRNGSQGKYPKNYIPSPTGR